MAETGREMTWNVKFSLITNPNVVKAWLKAMLWTYLLCIGFLVPMFAGTGEWDAIPPIMLIFLAVCGGIALLGLLVMLVILGNRSEAQFSLSPRGVVYRCMDRKIKTLSRIAVVSGGFFGSPRTAGAGLISMSREEVSLEWPMVANAVFDEKHHTIRLRNSYRDLLHLYCTKDNYDSAEGMVRHYMAAFPAAAPVQKTRPPLRGIGISLLVSAACLPLYALTQIMDLHLMAGLLITAFALATVWMVPLFGWVVLLGEGYVIGWIVVKLAETRTLKLVNTYRFKGYEVLDAGEWIVLLLALAGMAYLAWLSIRAIKGRLVPVLMQE